MTKGYFLPYMQKVCKTQILVVIRKTEQIDQTNKVRLAAQKIGGLVCVGDQSVGDYYMMQFYKNYNIVRDQIFGGLVCVRG